MFPMAESTKTPILYALSPSGKSQQQRYTVAALVYFFYGVCYFFGSQYFMSMQDTERGMAYAAYATFFFIAGGLITVVFPLLIYSRFALAVSWNWRPHAQYKTLHISFTMLLGFLVIFRSYLLLRSNAFMKTPLHMAALIITVINATCLIWAGMSRPVWVTRESVEPS
jgi:MFS family permease